MNARCMTTATLVSLLGIVASGCERNDTRVDVPPTMLAEVAPTKHATAPTALDETAPTSPGKPLPPIDVEYAIVGVPTVGQPLEIELRTRAPAALAAMNLALRGSERLQVPAEIAQLRLAFSAANERRIETIRITPLTPGRHYLSILAEADIGGRRQARSVTIPIDVGGAAVAVPRTGTVSVDTNGERIISLPAQQ
jgi:hypothetical protein